MTPNLPIVLPEDVAAAESWKGMWGSFAERLPVEDLAYALARHRTQAIAEERARASDMLLEAISEGYPAPPNKVDQCVHGRFGWEDCIACYDEMLTQTATTIRQETSV